jgi:hypothetical protein
MRRWFSLAWHPQWWVGLLALAALLAGCSQGQTTSASTSTQSATVGGWASLGNGLKLQLTSVHVSLGMGDDVPAGGSVYLICNVSVLNTTSQAQNLYTVTTFSLQGSGSELYTQLPLSFVQSPDGSIAAQATVQGAFAFEVPQTQSHFTLLFRNNGLQDMWAITVTPAASPELGRHQAQSLTLPASCISGTFARRTAPRHGLSRVIQCSGA